MAERLHGSKAGVFITRMRERCWYLDGICDQNRLAAKPVTATKRERNAGFIVIMVNDYLRVMGYAS